MFFVSSTPHCCDDVPLSLSSTLFVIIYNVLRAIIKQYMYTLNSLLLNRVQITVHTVIIFLTVHTIIFSYLNEHSRLVKKKTTAKPQQQIGEHYYAPQKHNHF